VAQLTLAQLKAFGIHPDTSLGQHFLTDDNILRVAWDLAGLAPEDVVFEPGPGVGVLTDFLASRVAHVHAVEIDRRLEPALAHATQDHRNVSVIWGDAVDVDPAALEPQPTALVSNLPYHVSAILVAETLQRAPSVRNFCVMVQKEVGERFFAPEGGGSYGAVSVLIRLMCERTGTHKVSRAVFIPRPNVDSMLVSFVRRDAGIADRDVAAFATFVRGVFAHRRKTLGNNLANVVAKERIDELCAAAGVDRGVRPERVTPEQFLALARAAGVVA
jgi:16S rRNA (adenine1518-N6/adenine1519-N6)-dimethyltransferase